MWFHHWCFRGVCCWRGLPVPRRCCLRSRRLLNRLPSPCVSGTRTSLPGAAAHPVLVLEPPAPSSALLSLPTSGRAQTLFTACASESRETASPDLAFLGESTTFVSDVDRRFTRLPPRVGGPRQNLTDLPWISCGTQGTLLHVSSLGFLIVHGMDTHRLQRMWNEIRRRLRRLSAVLLGSPWQYLLHARSSVSHFPRAPSRSEQEGRLCATL